MTAYNIVRTRVKRERQAEFENVNRELLFEGASNMQGLRHLVVLHPSSTNYCLVGEWDSYDALADARSFMAANLVEIRPMLEDLGGGLGVTYAVSGETLLEFTPTMAPLPRQGAPPRAYNVVRQRVKAGRLKDYESTFRLAFDSFSTEAPAGLCKVAVVVGLRTRRSGVRHSPGARIFCTCPSPQARHSKSRGYQAASASKTQRAARCSRSPAGTTQTWPVLPIWLTFEEGEELATMVARALEPKG